MSMGDWRVPVAHRILAESMATQLVGPYVLLLVVSTNQSWVCLGVHVTHTVKPIYPKLLTSTAPSARRWRWVPWAHEAMAWDAEKTAHARVASEEYILAILG